MSTTSGVNFRLFRHWVLLTVAAAGCRTPAPVPAARVDPAQVRSQNPSPMVENARKHDRLVPGPPAGITFRIDSVFSRPVDVFIPERPQAGSAEERTLLVHLFGASFVAMQAVSAARNPYVAAVVNLGGGSSSYEGPISDSARWNTLIRKVREETSARTSGRIRINRIVVSAFSAGYGGVRALLSNDRIAGSIDGVILLDGLHTSYVPERTVLSEGGVLDTTKLLPFLRYARRAAAGDTRMLITHSEIFPGTFASTTETTDWMISALGRARVPVLQWGPGGMQQTSELHVGHLLILGFAGNTGPDHIDHLHGLPGFLEQFDHILQ